MWNRRLFNAIQMGNRCTAFHNPFPYELHLRSFHFEAFNVLNTLRTLWFFDLTLTVCASIKYSNNQMMSARTQIRSHVAWKHGPKINVYVYCIYFSSLSFQHSRTHWERLIKNSQRSKWKFRKCISWGER